MLTKIHIIPLLLALLNSSIYSQEKKGFEQSYNELTDMLEGKQTASFEKAVFLAENPYLNNKYNFKSFQIGIDQHLNLIHKLIEANDRSDSIDFSVIIDRSKPMDVRLFRYTPAQKKELYQKALTNWAIFTYMTDTIESPYSYHYPFSYQINDPFGINDWTNSQVINLLTSDEQKGNCLALVALFKIFSERLDSDAIVCTAPGHIYLRHKNEKGEVYNVELATGSHPGDGSIRTLTYTNREALMSDIALRQLDNTQNIVLCLVNLGKSYERKYNTKSDDFVLKCAETALKYDSLSLNAHLLKLQVLEDRAINYAIQHQLSLEELKQDKAIANTYGQLEKQLTLLYDLGYRQMSMEMQEMVLAGLQKKEIEQAILVKDPTPSPFASIQPKDKSDTRYSTLSGGIYPEVHEKKPIEVYGRLAFDTQKKQIVTYDTSSTYGLLIDPVAFAWSIDPHASSYPSWSPYAAFADNPIIYVDPDGRDNIIYLLVLPSANEKLTMADKQEIINESNNLYKKMGLNTRVVLFENAENFNPDFMDANDSYALLGNSSEIKTMQSKNGFWKQHLGHVYTVDNPEKSSILRGGHELAVGINIAFELNRVFAKKYFNLDQNKGVAFTLVHGSTHNSGMEHNQDYNTGIGRGASFLAGILHPEFEGFKMGIVYDDNGEIITPSDEAISVNEALELSNIAKNKPNSVHMRNVNTFGRGIFPNGSEARANYNYVHNFLLQTTMGKSGWSIPYRNPVTVDEAEKSGTSPVSVDKSKF
ncbi:MAG: hypothetical protein N4A35_11360 [Flavobacteriales bacterium]|jgi:hypothetical protein|nr:hypothetical protein [Flavobacteriales bacterium]